jgi:glycosyltransferase involved in cell wall biosynthesis
MHRDQKRKKIALVIQRFGSGINGGAEVHASQIAERLSLNHDLTVLTSCAKNYDSWLPVFHEGETFENGIRILRFNHPRRGLPPIQNFKYRILKSILTALRPLGVNNYKKSNRWIASMRLEMDELYIRRQGPYTPELIQYIKSERENYDCFIFFTYLYYPTVFGIQEVPEKSILIPMIHDEPAVYRSIFEKVIHSSRFIFFNTEAEKTFAEKRFNLSEIDNKIVATGINTPNISNDAGVLEKYKIHTPFIMYLGRIEEGKGCKKLIEWHADFCEKEPTAPGLLMVGQNIMKEDIRGRAVFTGFISEFDKNELLAQCKAIVVPSEYESLSLCLLEAFALGKPGIVNGKCQVLKAHIELGNAGWTFEGKTEFENCLRELVQNPEKAVKYGNNGRNYVTVNYNWDSIMHSYQNAIDQLTS